jgi:phytoene dehydrogenase-like protein
MRDEYDVIIIGAGVGGLAAAGLLARAGRRVLVLERHAVVGGCCSTFRRAHFVFDAAVHAIGGCAPGDIIGNWLTEMGIGDELRFVPLDPFYAIAVADKMVHMPANLDNMQPILAALAPEETPAVCAFIEDIKMLGEALLSDEKSGSMKRAQALEQVGRQSWAQFLAERFRSPHLIATLDALCLYAGLEPEKVSAAFMISVLASYQRGAYYPIGSTQHFVDSLAQAVQKHGGEILKRATVEKIVMDANGVVGVHFIRKNARVEAFAPVIISNADATKTLFEWVGPEHLPMPFQRKFQRMERSVSALCMYLAVRAGEWNVPSHETFYLPAWEPITTQQFYYVPGSNGPAPVMSICVPSQSDPGLAPLNCHVVSVTAAAYAATIEALREEKGKAFIEQDMLRHIETMIPGITRQIIYKELATSSTIERYTNNSSGAIYGWAKSAEQWPTNIGPKTPIPGLYLAGHWTQGGHGIYGAFRSGVLTARTVLQAEAVLPVRMLNVRS